MPDEAFGQNDDYRVITNRDIIVIGTSAGGVEALQKIVSDLPKTLSASVFVVMHIPGWRRTELPEILSRRSNLPVLTPRNNETIEPGRIYIAPADYHLLIDRNKRITLWHGPKENNFRPAINPLFRSAADVYGNRVIGVILTGTLDEGIAGLAWVKRHEGTTVVQDPEEAKFPGMPQTALMHVPIDYIRPASGMASLLAGLVNGSRPTPDTPIGRRS